ncbi:MAG: hypothetical protein IKE01_06025 [Clostridia bacterium]|nr:hypothetical protein [Clostridia bacterium]
MKETRTITLRGLKPDVLMRTLDCEINELRTESEEKGIILEVKFSRQLVPIPGEHVTSYLLFQELELTYPD